MKHQLLNIPEEILKNEGAISSACAEAMAVNIRKLTGADFGISFTGVAGPAESESKPAGTVFIGISDKKGTYSRELALKGTRESIRIRTVKHGLDILRRHLIKK
jgi:nicotinamide-nucleotide amidase